MKKIVTIDPGDHIGTLIAYDRGFEVCYSGLTICGDNRLEQLWKQLNMIEPDVIVFERFALRAKSAQKLVGNTFITCEVIGVIKLYCQLHTDVKLVEQTPDTKEYCGFSSNPKDEHYKVISIVDGKITEHVRDAFRLYNFYKLFGEK